MLRRAHRSRNGTLPFGTNKEQQLALMQQTKDSPTKDRLALLSSLTAGGANGDESFTASENDQIPPEFVPPSSSSIHAAAPPPPPPQNGQHPGESLHEEDPRKEADAMEVNMEDDDRRSHMDLMAENNPLEDDEDEGKKMQ